MHKTEVVDFDYVFRNAYLHFILGNFQEAYRLDFT